MGLTDRFNGAILLLLFFLLPDIARPQASTQLNFEISVPSAYGLSSSATDAARIQALMAANPAAASALSGLAIDSFRQEFPGSHYQYLRNIYMLTCANTPSNSAAVLSLHAADSISFPYLRQMPVIMSLGTYTPDDYHGLPGLDCSFQLDYLNATTAWGITKGNPNITIGINDPSGFDLHNPDLIGQIVGVGRNSPDFHGTAVAGCAAARTDNGIGIAAIGFNCSLYVDNSGGDATSLSMSGAGLKVINNSWFYGSTCTSTYSPLSFIGDELLYDEVYENGTSTCFAAGNGLSGGGACLSIFDYEYPSSLDHIITVGPAGHQNPLGTYIAVNPSTPSSGIPWLWRDCHEESPGNANGEYGTLNYQANDRVDICAPAYNIVTTNYAPDNASIHYTSQACGTSFASPIVAGTLGLMLSANPCLSPYQLEYLLKTTARSMEDVEYPPGSGNNLNAFYVGKMGAGAMDAGAAVTAASTFDCNDPGTQTMYIEGIGINTICEPGFSNPPGINPQFSVIIDNGTPPYVCRWDAIPGNNTTLNDYTSVSPTVTSGNFAAYRLGVYDSSPIPKEASRLIVVDLTTEQTPKLVLRDSYMDMLNEPNTQATYDAYDWDIWLSPDIVNTVSGNAYTMINQNPVYSATAPNYVTARVSNVGCTTYSGSGTDQLLLYWTMAGTGETWPDDWTTATYTNPATGMSWPAGGQITTTPIGLDPIFPGQQELLSSPWYPPNPLNYDSTLSTVDVCLLGRIQTSPSYPYGMTYPEDSNSGTNVLNNNKIATRNLIETGPMPVGHVGWHQVVLANSETTEQQFSIEIASDRHLHPSFAGDMSAYMSVEVELGALYDRWVANGSQGTNISSVNSKSGTVTFTGDSKIVLQGITLHAGEKYAARVGVTLTQQPTKDLYFHIQQWLTPAGNEKWLPYGNVTFRVPAGATTGIAASNPAGGAALQPSLFAVYPNPASNTLAIYYTGAASNIISYAISDVSGGVLLKQSGVNVMSGTSNSIDVSSLSDGLYFITITDMNNRSTIKKIVKAQ